MTDVSVCIPIYYKESVDTIKQCFKSLFKQTVKPKEIVCILDDPSSPEIEELLGTIKEESKINIKLCYCKRNSGLGAVLKMGIEQCTCEYIARMDVDDIAVPMRLEKQILFLDKFEKIDVVGSNIAEFDHSINNIIAYRNVPSADNECKRMLKYRDPINHMTAMYRRESVLKAGNYSEKMKSNEDTYLWVAFYEHGLTFANIQDNLVYVHAGKEMYSRRGGEKSYYFVKEAIKYKKKVGLTNALESVFQKIANYLILVIMPREIRSYIYEHFLRKR